MEEGFIGGGMLPKLGNCTSAIKNGGNGIGTAIVKDEDLEKMDME